MDMESAKIAFVQEARELLGEMENALLRMESDGLDDESIHAVFRAAHTIKGSSGLFGQDEIVSFTHVLETILDEIRSGKFVPDSSTISLFLECGDHLGSLVGNFEQNLSLSAEQAQEGSSLVQKLQGARRNAERSLVVPTPPESPVEEITRPVDGVANDAWHISLRLATDVLKSGMDPLSFFRYMATLGRIVQIDVIDDLLPPSAKMDPENLYLGFEIQFISEATRKDIEGVFEFVAEGSTIRILPPHSKIETYLELIRSLPESPNRLGEILLSCGALTEAELALVLRMQENTATGKPPLGEMLVKEHFVPPVVVAAALQKQKVSREKTIQESRSVKVDVAKLDHLIDLVGELVIAAAGAKIAADREKSAPVEEAVGMVSKLVEEIRDAALGVRMVPIGEVFQRFPRLVRDLSMELGKRVELDIQGAETELDKSMVERLAEPLTHMVRNSLDHGMELESTRLAAGKPAQGTIRFNAYHDTGSIVIEVADDGAGIHRQRVLERAIERGIVPHNHNLSDREILNLIFEPGFSTSQTVTNLSGRGVGMDVVKRSIESLRGEIEIESEEGVGTEIRLRMPLTLAIIDGFMVAVEDRSFVVPLDLVIECADLPREVAIREQGRGIANLRGEPLPLVRLRELFHIPGQAPARENIVVVEYGGKRLGLVVEGLLGEFQAVIKPLSRLFSKVPGVGGSTILGTGEIALILDVPALVQRIERVETTRWAPTSASLPSASETKALSHAT
ncbi:MAG: chemotaxis protein CheA [Fibrobacteres bacterium]|nr:chemotaxis protein CheA [Fibrobacterota bacterium]